jgi:hypothetical protein
MRGPNLDLMLPAVKRRRFEIEQSSSFFSVPGGWLSSGAEVRFPDVVAPSQCLARTLHHNSPCFHYVRVMGNQQGIVGILGGEQDRDAFGGNPANHVKDQLYEDGSQPERRFIQEKKLRLGHEAPADCAHLLFPAR